MLAHDKDTVSNSVRQVAVDRHSDEYDSDSSENDYSDQDQYSSDDTQCPCYVCSNGVMDSKCSYSSDETSTGVEFAVRSFWRLAKTQNDVESPMEGHCRGFHYKLLLHPRGTAGTDSEASHLSVFVEASVQDWYPPYWVFPNVRFELTVVNFKDPKQSVTSWAHWSFSSDATSRGWQKMISHSRLTKASGFMDEEGTVLVRGKADPPYPMLWSNSPLYHPPMMWEYIPNRAQREIAAEANLMKPGNIKGKRLLSLDNPYPCLPNCSYEEHEPSCKNANLEFLNPDGTLNGDKDNDGERKLYAYPDLPGVYQFSKTPKLPTGFLEHNMKNLPLPNRPEGYDPQGVQVNTASSLATSIQNINEDSDSFTDINPEESLMQLQVDGTPNVSNNTILKFLDSVIPAVQPTLDADLLAIMTHILYHIREFRKMILQWKPPMSLNENERTGNGFIVALQKTFAYMELYPLAAACKAYKVAGIEPQQLSKYYLYELLPKIPSLRKGFGHSDMGDGTSAQSGTGEKNATHKYESNLQNPKYTPRAQKTKTAAWNRMYMPIPFPSPDEVPGYNAEGEEFSQVDCCHFDGGRYEWELKTRKARETDAPGAAMQSDQPTDSPDQPTIFSHVEKPSKDFKLFPGTLSYSIGNRGDVFDKLLPPPPNVKLLLKAMHMSDLQVLETQDQIIGLHTALFTMLLRDLAAAKRHLKRERITSHKPVVCGSTGTSSPRGAQRGLPWYLRDQTELEATCKALFSGGSEHEGLFHEGGVSDIATVYIRCKHSHSLQKALENTPKTMARFPHVLFFYLYPAKNAKKGELFDIPLRLDCTSLCDGSGTTEGANDLQRENHPQKTSTAGDNSSGPGGSEGPINYCDYTDEDNDEEEDDEGDEDGNSDTFTNFDGDGKKRKHSTPIKWYSLYALILREGEVRSENNLNGGGSFHSLLLRPEEDGPWYRIFEGRVEKLTTKMEFTEWKCHRDFFCSAAIYIAEDYIDMHQVGELDLGGTIKTWNPRLFYETLEELGITEGDISNPSFKPLSRRPSETLTERSNLSIDDTVSLADIGSVSSNVSPRENEISDIMEEAQADAGSSLVPNLVKEAESASQLQSEELAKVAENIAVHDYQMDAPNANIVYNRKVGQRHPRVGSCCEVHGYTPEFLASLREKEISAKYAKPASQKEICRRLNRANTIRPFLKWLFHASKENTALLNGLKPPADGKMLVKFLQQRERYFEEEFCHLICEVLLKEVGEHMALNSVYKWDGDKSCCGCNCSKCECGCPALLLTANGRFPGEDLTELLEEPSTILFRNIQILRCHLEYFCKDCRNLSLQVKEEHRYGEIHEFKATSERSALFLIECIWDACVRYTHDCRTILYLKAISDNPAATAAELGLNKVSTLIRPCALPTAKQNGNLQSSMDQCRDLFVFDGALSQNGGSLGFDSIDYYDSKYDLTVAEELKIMKHFAAKYQIPNVSKMRQYLRENHVLVCCFIRPHELLRAYLQVAHPGADIKTEIESLVTKITWNEAAFEQRVTLNSLTKEERQLYDVNPARLDVEKTIGHELCDIYEELITKMLLHMQDAERSPSGKVYDYIYTSTDVSKIAGAIESECTNTVSPDVFMMKPSVSDDACTCDLSPSECRMSALLPSTGYFADFGFSRGPFSLDFVEITHQPSGALSRRASFVSTITKTSDKKKQKSKVRKPPVEETCVIPPLDQAISELIITQKTAHRADPRIFPNLNDVIKYPNGPHCQPGTGVLGKIRRWGEFNSTLYHQALGYDFNVAGGFAAMLRFENHESKAKPNPLLNTRKHNEADALRIKSAYEIGIVTSQDFCGREGFAMEEKLVPTKRLLIFHEYLDERSGKKVPVRVEHLYWGLRKLLHQQLPADMDSTVVQAAKGKKAKGAVKCVCGGHCNTNEFECPLNMRWRPVPRDCFMLYALRPDNNNPIRRGRRRFTFMQPELEFSTYVDAGKRNVNPKTPDAIILMIAAPMSLCTTPSIPFPMMDDTEYPLLLFKWMSLDAVNLVCYGAVVCDAKKQLQHYIFEWLLPLVREMGVIPKLEPNEKEDIERYQILEECSVRTVQNVRRWSCAIRKINKRTGDIIIAQAKRQGDSPASMKFKEAAEFMDTIKELSELEALEVLPPAENTELVHDFTKTEIDLQEPPEKAVEDVQKLSKKKKKKTPKTAIPSNKKSTFSKTIVSVEAQPEKKVAQELEAENGKSEVSTKVEAPFSSQAASQQKTEEDEDEEYDDDYDDEEEEEEEDEDQEAEEQEHDASVEERVTIAALVEEVFDGVATGKNVIDITMIEKNGIQNYKLADLIQRLSIPNMLTEDESLVTELCTHIQKVAEEEEEESRETPRDTEISKDCVPVTIGKRTRMCVDMVLSIIRSHKNYALLYGLKEVIQSLYKAKPMAAVGILSYALCALGNITLTEHMKLNPMVEFVSNAVKKMAEQCTEHGHSFFDDGETKHVVSSLLVCLLIYSSLNKTIEEQCYKDGNLSFLMNVVRDKLTPMEEDPYGEEETSEMGFRADTLAQSLDQCEPDDVNLAEDVIEAFKSRQSPFSEEETLARLEMLSLQELKIWWYRRETAMYSIRDRLSAGKVAFTISNNAAHLEERYRMDNSAPLPISQLEMKCLRNFISRFKDELDVEMDGDTVKMCLHDFCTGSPRMNGDPKGVIKAVETLLQLIRGNNMSRAVANSGLDAVEKRHIFADLDELRLWGKQGALVTMSMRHTCSLNSLSTQDIEGIVQHYYARSLKSIPQPPKLPPQHPRI